MMSGTVLVTLGTIWVHYSGIPPTELVDGVSVPVQVDYFNWVPRGWFSKGIGYLVVFAASQMMIAGGLIRFVLGLPMTWARASFAAVLIWMELVLIFGIVPSEWLNLSQTDLNWSPQRIAFTVPSWLVLGNTIEISYAAIKDSISGVYNLGMLVVAGWFAFRWQQPKKRPPKPEPTPPLSPYGRPLVESKG